DGLSIDPATGLITGTPALDAAAAPVDSTITAGDGTYSTSRTVTWEIDLPRQSGPVTLADPGWQYSTEGDSVALPLVARGSSGTLTYSADGLPPGLGMDAVTGLITGTPAAGAAAAGPYRVTVTASDGTNSTGVAFLWEVDSAPAATGTVSVTNPGWQSGTEG